MVSYKSPMFYKWYRMISCIEYYVDSFCENYNNRINENCEWKRVFGKKNLGTRLSATGINGKWNKCGAHILMYVLRVYLLKDSFDIRAFFYIVTLGNYSFPDRVSCTLKQGNFYNPGFLTFKYLNPNWKTIQKFRGDPKLFRLLGVIRKMLINTAEKP